MIGLDTNVLVIYLTQDDPKQAPKATRTIETGAARGETFFISSIVMCELIWVLGTAYDYGRGEISDVLESVLRTRQFTFEDKDLLWQSLADFKSLKGDFSDYLLGRKGLEAGCAQTLTFDKNLKNSSHFEVL